MNVSTSLSDSVISSVIDARWQAFPGAHGGHVAAVALGAVRDGFASGAQPVRSMTTHFLSPADVGPLHVSASAPSVGRSAATCVFAGRQGTADGSPVLVGSVVLGPARPGPAYDGERAPAVPSPGDCQPITLPADIASFSRQLEIRAAGQERLPTGEERAEFLFWVRFTDGRPLDAGAVVTLTDVLPPGLYACGHASRPMPTAELTVHFTDVLDDRAPEGWALVRNRTAQAGGGWAVDDSAVWSADGRLLGLGRQARVVLNQAQVSKRVGHES
ncbi:acyl-CoA thioesterase [Streptomyces sp. 3214.6]|uniref:acyl-CoA thioesterase n=1 Tax=Streptomyces sp. 3214.6 TaxID=1882757 RepID=UPI00090C810B|nr:thioesterase family protein [Streptomyces sp. 3214.6]SHH31609.1 Acyl-CoA thioesterase [Streptomyces sp. 3214.6]